MTDPIRIICAGPPVAKRRARMRHLKTVHGQYLNKPYTPAKTRQYETFVRQEAALIMNGRDPLDGPIMLNVLAFLPIPQSWSKKKQREAMYVTTKPDWDNLAKSVTDALNGIVYTDDKLIVDAFVQKRYDKRPRVEITVQEMPGLTT